MRTPCSASATPSSTSGTSVMQTGQPGPMITFRSLGKTERRPKRAIACSWLPQTCITLATRPMSSVALWSALVSARARAGSRNFISASWGSLPRRMRGLELAAHVGGHQILWLGLAQDGVEQLERLADLVLRDAVDGKAHVVEHVVARPDRHVDDVEAHLALHAEEVHRGHQPIDGQHLARDAETHAAASCRERAVPEGPQGAGITPRELPTRRRERRERRAVQAVRPAATARAGFALR